MTQIFVGNLAYTTSEGELRSTFEHYGRVSSVKLVTDPQTGKPRGFAFVAMARLDDADEAITRLNGASLAGRQIVVNEAHAKNDSHSRMDPTPRRTPVVDSFWDRL
jgi:RNA recognition motif-containing protein